MKKPLLFTMLIVSTLFLSFTGGGYETAMKNTLDTLHQAKNQTDFLAAANKFERIGAAEKDKWLPYYYTAYCYVIITTVEKDKTKWDGYLDTADNNLNKAEKLKGDMVEILTLNGFSSMMRINVDPNVRGQEYSMKSAGFIQQANQLDDQNPRVLLMLGQLQYGTAKFFGSSTEEACKMFSNAKKIFEEEVIEDLGILPSWGKPQVESMIEQCLKTSVMSK